MANDPIATAFAAALRNGKTLTKNDIELVIHYGPVVLELIIFDSLLPGMMVLNGSKK